MRFFQAARLCAALVVLAWSAVSAAGQPLRLAFAGDVMAHTPNFTHKPYANIYQGVRHLLADAELSFANLEFPVDDGAPYASYPLFNVHSEYVQAAIDAGFNVFSLANNHSADRGAAGVGRTEAALAALAAANRTAGREITSNGLRPRDSDPPWKIEVRTVRGMKVGFVALAEWVNETQHTKRVQYYDCRFGVSDQPLLDWIKSVRPLVDLLVLSYHWGDEYHFVPTKARTALAGRLVEAGVDIIWGNHPHVLQQWYVLDSPRGKALVMPSLGNFISGQTWSVTPDRKGSIDAAKGNSVIFKVEVARDAAGRLSFPELAPVLVSAWKNPEGQLVTRTNADILAESKGAWLAFWKYRNALMTDFIAGSAAAAERYGKSTD